MKSYILSRTILLSVLLLASSVQTPSVLAASTIQVPLVQTPSQTSSMQTPSIRASILQTQIVPYIQTENCETQYQSSQEQLAVVEQELAVTQEDLVTAQDQLATSQDQLATTQDELAQAESEIQSLIDSCSSSDPACASELESTQELLLVTRESYLDALTDIGSLSDELIETQASYLDALTDIGSLSDELVETQASYLDALVDIGSLSDELIETQASYLDALTDIGSLSDELIETQASYLDALETIGSLQDEFSTIGSLMDELDACDTGVATTQDAILSLDLTIGSLIDDLIECGSLVDVTEESIQEVLIELEPVLPVLKIATGLDHSVILLENGSVWAAGKNEWGQLGTGNTFTRWTFSPMIIDPAALFIDIAAGDQHSLVLKNDGTVWATGRNIVGQLGIGTSGDFTVTLTEMTDFNNNITAIAAGGSYSLVLKNDGTVWGTGGNTVGQLGVGTSGDFRVTLTEMTDFNNDIAAIAAGSNHSLVLKSDGTVWATGYNSEGQLGIGTSGDFRVTLTEMTDFNSSVTALSGGSNHSLVLKNDGTVWATGYNSSGQLGIGSTTQQLTLTAMTLNNSSITALAGSDSSLVLKNDGTVWATGYNGSGQLARGFVNNSNTTLAPTKRSFSLN